MNATLAVLFAMSLCIFDKHSAGLLCILSFNNERQLLQES